MKSNLNRPLKHLIRRFSSSLPKAAMDVAVCSKSLLEAIVTPLKDVGFTSIVSSMLLTHFLHRFVCLRKWPK